MCVCMHNFHFIQHHYNYKLHTYNKHKSSIKVEKQSNRLNCRRTYKRTYTIIHTPIHMYMCIYLLYKKKWMRAWVPRRAARHKRWNNARSSGGVWGSGKRNEQAKVMQQCVNCVIIHYWTTENVRNARRIIKCHCRWGQQQQQWQWKRWATEKRKRKGMKRRDMIAERYIANS